MPRRLADWIETFPPGRVPLLLLVLALVTGAAVARRSALPEPAALSVWTFTHIALEEFKGILADHPRWTLVGRAAAALERSRAADPPAPRADDGRTPVELTNLGTAMFDRLALSLMTRTELPGLVEVEQSRVGRYLRGPAAHIPFVDLTDRLKSEGWYGDVIPARFARYSVAGRIFGVPHDVHPMVLVYRPDVLADLGHDPNDIVTWDDFIAIAQEFYRPGERGTRQWRAGLALQTTEGWDFLMLLWQRGGDIFDAEDAVAIDSPLAVDTLEFFVSLLTMDPPAAGPKASDWTEDYRALANGQFLAYAAPDWMLAAMQLDTKSVLDGKVRCMPLPAWEPGGRRTSTSGGTAMLIPKGAGDPDAAWTLLKDLYFDREALIARFERQTIIPPLTTVYDDPAFDQPMPFFQGQPVGRLLTQLALEVPPVHGSPYMPEASKLIDIIIPQVLSGARTPAEALDDVARKLEAVMARDRAAIEAAGGS